MSASSDRTGLRGQPRAALVGILTLVTFIAFDSLGVATAMPAIGAELQAAGAYSLVFSMFLAGALAGQGAAGGWSDVAGPSRPLILGLGLFVAGMAGCALAESLSQLLVARCVSGVGGGLVMVANYVLIAEIFDEAARPKVFTWVSAAWVLPALIGPAIAGWLTTTISWRVVFWAGVPFATAAGLMLIPTALRVPRPPTHDTTGVRRRGVRAVVLAAAVTALPWAVQSQGALGWRVPIGLVSAAAIVATLPRLLPAGTLTGRRGLTAAIAVRAVVPGAYFGAETYIPLALHTERGMSLTAAGLVLTAASLGWAFGSWLQGRDTRVGADRYPLLVRGALLVTAGIAVLPLVLVEAVTPWVGAVIWGIAAIGMGLAVATTSVVVMALSPAESRGRDGAALQLSEGVGGVTGVAVGGAIYAFGQAPLGADTVFAALWWVLAALAVVGVLLARRVRPAV